MKIENILLKLFVMSLINEDKENDLIHDLKNKTYNQIMDRFDNYAINLKDIFYINKMRNYLQSHLNRTIIIKFLIYTKERKINNKKINNKKFLPYKSMK
uniref:Uncharacterized protein n=1 Tax=viral metagenome TaxID=1070528 RepID=A0A6C0AGB1_9ZZZZ